MTVPSTPDVAGSWQVMVSGSAPPSGGAPTGPQSLSGGASAPAAFTAAPQVGGTKSAYGEMLEDEYCSSDSDGGGAKVEASEGAERAYTYNPLSFSAKRPPVQKSKKRVRFVLPEGPGVRVPERGVTTSKPVRARLPSYEPRGPPFAPSRAGSSGSGPARIPIGLPALPGQSEQVFDKLCGKLGDLDHGDRDTGCASQFEKEIRRYLNEGCPVCGLPSIQPGDKDGHRGSRVAARHFFRCTQPTDRERNISNYEARVRCVLHCEPTQHSPDASNTGNRGRGFGGSHGV
jgi:hypothetical protein